MIRKFLIDMEGTLLTNRDKQYNEQELVINLQKGDETAFVELIKQFETSIFLCCRSLGLNESEAEDAASETFLAAYEGINKYQGKSGLGTWLWKIAYWKSVDCLRRRKRLRQNASNLSEDIADSRNYNLTIEQKETVEIIWEKVNQLPKLWSLAIILFYREGKNISEISTIMNVKKETVKTYLFRGKKKLSTILKKIFKEELDGIE